MKKLKFLILLFIFNCTLLIVNAQSIYFNKRISITDNLDVCRGIIPFKNGYLVAGGFEDEYSWRHLYLSQLDSIGDLKWTKDYTIAPYNYYFGLSGSLFQTKDKHYALCGGRVLGLNKGYGIFVKVDSFGNKDWEKIYQLLDYDNVLNCGKVTKEGGYIFTGDAQTGTTKYSYLLLKTDSMGNQQWYKTYTDNHPNRNYTGKCVIETPDKGYCLGGMGGIGLYLS